MLGGATTDATRFTAGRLLGSLKIAETGVTARFLMIAKDFIPGMGAKSFAIIEDGRQYEVSGAPGAAVAMYAMPE